ncbi:hypothetical protein [Knoellia sp. Soil729]|uniref:hypothetical protein n=1 Tax=Knoellia sp. Soil729 TaxID=1736394 RepID=UPI0006FC1AF4|nr:hypothetical protein [Knoellia sp. Soil729]KRE43449.1 hypothetical protein ASG74_00925 [Knoellia sp. Soil729]
MRVQRWEPTDALLRDDVALVFVRGTVVRLSELSTAIFTLTEDPIAVDDLAAELKTRFGAPKTGSTLDATKDAVADLIRNGILRRV